MCSKVYGGDIVILILEVLDVIHVHFKKITTLIQGDQSLRMARISKPHQHVEHMRVVHVPTPIIKNLYIHLTYGTQL